MAGIYRTVYWKLLHDLAFDIIDDCNKSAFLYISDCLDYIHLHYCEFVW